MKACEFGLGEWLTKQDGVAVVTEVFAGQAFGRYTWGCRVAWAPGCWNATTGRAAHGTAYDLLPPEPPVVVSDEAEQAYKEGRDRAHPVSNGVKAGLAAAYPIMLRDNSK